MRDTVYMAQNEKGKELLEDALDGVEEKLSEIEQLAKQQSREYKEIHEFLKTMMVQRVSSPTRNTPPDGTSVSKINAFSFDHETVPYRDPHTQSIKIGSWEHYKSSLKVDVWMNDADEDMPWGVQVESDDGLIYSHPVRSFDGALMMVEAFMYSMGCRNPEFGDEN